MFINFTNHPSALWSAEQKAAAQVYGKVIDLAFPAIDPATNEAVLDSLATVYADHILHLDPDAVLCQGECTFVYRVVQRLEAAGIPTLAACSRRKSQETTYPDGSTLKRSIFAFAGFAAMARPEKGFQLFHRRGIMGLPRKGTKTSLPCHQSPCTRFQLLPARGRKLDAHVVGVRSIDFNLSPQGDGNAHAS